MVFNSASLDTTYKFLASYSSNMIILPMPFNVPNRIEMFNVKTNPATGAGGLSAGALFKSTLICTRAETLSDGKTFPYYVSSSPVRFKYYFQPMSEIVNTAGSDTGPTATVTTIVTDPDTSAYVVPSQTSKQTILAINIAVGNTTTYVLSTLNYYDPAVKYVVSTVEIGDYVKVAGTLLQATSIAGGTASQISDFATFLNRRQKVINVDASTNTITTDLVSTASNMQSETGITTINTPAVASFGGSSIYVCAHNSTLQPVPDDATTTTMQLYIPSGSSLYTGLLSQSIRVIVHTGGE